MTITQCDGYWKFDESSGNAADATVNGNTMTNNNTATYGAGALNNATTLNGTTQYFNHVDNALLSPTTGFSVSAWINLSSLPGGGEYAVMRKGDTVGSQNSFSCELGVEVNGLYVIYTNSGSYSPNSAIQEWDSAASILPATGGWHHYMFVLDAVTSNGVLTCYIDNVSKTMTKRGGDGPISSIFDGTDDFYIGGAASGGRYLAGSMDECAYWKNYQLTSGEVSTLYNSGTPPTYATLFGGTLPAMGNILTLGVG